MGRYWGDETRKPMFTISINPKPPKSSGGKKGGGCLSLFIGLVAAGGGALAIAGVGAVELLRRTT